MGFIAQQPIEGFHKSALKVDFTQIWRSTNLISLIFLIAPPNIVAIPTLAVPDFSAIETTALATNDSGGKRAAMFTLLLLFKLIPVTVIEVSVPEKSTSSNRMILHPVPPICVRYREPPQIERYTGLAPDRASAPETGMVFAVPVGGTLTSRWASTR